MDSAFSFPGFSTPNGTIIPDEVFDVLMPVLSESELKVLLYVARRTFGFKKDADHISLQQLQHGITTRDGRILDHGTGLSKTSILKGVKGLVEKGVLAVNKGMSAQGDSEINLYALRFRPGVVQNVNHPSTDSARPGRPEFAPTKNRSYKKQGTREYTAEDYTKGKYGHLVEG